MSKIIIPKGYQAKLDLIETEKAIKLIKDTFQIELAKQLHLTRVSAPLFLLKNTGLNDNLNGIESPVSFTSHELNDTDEIEIIHSLAKWKRDALHRYNFGMHTGLYTDMNAIRKDEDLDNIHSMYVDQWDWECIISKEDRTLEYFKNIVKKIYNVMLHVEDLMLEKYQQLDVTILPKEIYFITSQELENKYPTYDGKQRENAIAKEKGAVCILQIGDILASGERHDGRSPDYDDWTMNGDIIVWNSILEEGLELSSMGIRVDSKALLAQLEKADAMERTSLPYHKNVINDVLPLSVGGGIGQSRLCMFFLRKAHIGEVQASLWDQDTLSTCKEKGIQLL
ncbi:MAG: aspartate--ammonia ligase [Coprobacillaceae bacterium]